VVDEESSVDVVDDKLIYDPSKIINVDLVEAIYRLGMSKDDAELLVYLYENGDKIGFTATELGYDEEEFMNFMDIDWVRPVNLKKIGKEYFVVYKVNDLYKILESIKKKKQEIYKSDMALVATSIGLIDEELVKACRPKVRLRLKNYTTMETNDVVIRRKKTKTRGRIVDEVKQMVNRDGKRIRKKKT